MDAEVLYAAPRFVIAAKKNPWSRRRRVRLADLMNEPWALPSAESPQGALDVGTFRAAGLELPAAAVVADHAAARLALVAGGAVSHHRLRRHIEVRRLGHGCCASVDRYAGHPQPGRDRHIEEPDAHARGAAFHRLRARGGKAAGDRQVGFDATSTGSTNVSMRLAFMSESGPTRKADRRAGGSAY